MRFPDHILAQLAAAQAQNTGIVTVIQEPPRKNPMAREVDEIHIPGPWEMVVAQAVQELVAAQALDIAGIVPLEKLPVKLSDGVEDEFDVEMRHVLKMKSEYAAKLQIHRNLEMKRKHEAKIAASNPAAAARAYMDSAHLRGDPSDPGAREADILNKMEKITKSSDEKAFALADRIVETLLLKKKRDQDIAGIIGEAYFNLERLVRQLILVPNGNERLGTKDKELVSAMADAAAAFKILSDRTDELTQKFGRLSSDQMQYGDESDNFLTEIQSYEDSLKVEVANIDSRMASERSAIATLRELEGDLGRAVGKAEEKCHNAGNQFVSFFDNDRGRDLEQNFADARRILHKNQAMQAEHDRKYSQLNALKKLIEDTWYQLSKIQGGVRGISYRYDVEFSKLSDVRDATGSMWAGILKLKDYICSPTVRSTRDNTLRAILQLLATDDAVLNDDAVAEAAQLRIHLMINGHLGLGAVQKLQEPSVIPLEEFALEWPEGLP